MTVSTLIKEGWKLFDAKKYSEAIDKLNQAWKMADKENDIQQQINIQSWLGHVYLEQAQQTNDKQLFDQVVKHLNHYLTLAKQLKGESGIQEQSNAEHWLGRCYLTQALQTKGISLFVNAIKHFNQQLILLEQLEGWYSVLEQSNAQSWLGRCYLTQALQTKGISLFVNAIKHFNQQLTLAEQLNGESGLQEQSNAQSWLGFCYFEQFALTKNNSSLSQAVECFEQQLNLAKQLEGEGGFQKQSKAQSWLGRCYLERIKNDSEMSEKTKKEYLEKIRSYFEQALAGANQITDTTSKIQACSAIQKYQKETDFVAKEYDEYFAKKQKDIKEKLSERWHDELKESIATILAVLSISPVEFDKPLAHYTSPNVCEKLLGIKQRYEDQSKLQANPMRMNSSTYMNDPYEGKSLADFLGIQEINLENQTKLGSYNAFFVCFSSRVNDLNQFRLYGKVDNIEASGCCLVFNKNKTWIQEPDISTSYRQLGNQCELGDNKLMDEAVLQSTENLSLYQIGYIFYRDEYTKNDEYDILTNDKDPKFGIRLKPISDNNTWHEKRKKELQEALAKLQQFFKSDSTQKQETYPSYQDALEYIRYLFKDYAFRDEEEFRLLRIEELGAEPVQYCPTTNSAFVAYGDICSQLDEVILGTNYECTEEGLKVEVFQHLLKQKLPNIKVSHSSLPIAFDTRFRKR